MYRSCTEDDRDFDVAGDCLFRARQDAEFHIGTHRPCHAGDVSDMGPGGGDLRESGRFQCLVMRSSPPIANADTTKVRCTITYHMSISPSTFVMFMNTLSR